MVKASFASLFKNIFSGTKSVEKFNNTLIFLITKIHNPISINQFFLISLCNVSSKILSKIIVNRTKPYMSSLISEEQTSFIPSR